MQLNFEPPFMGSQVHRLGGSSASLQPEQLPRDEAGKLPGRFPATTSQAGVGPLPRDDLSSGGRGAMDSPAPKLYRDRSRLF